MRLTKELKAWLVKNAGVSDTITDDRIYQRAAADCMFIVAEGEPGYLSGDMLATLTSTDKAAAGASRLSRTLGRLEQRLGGPNPDDLFADGAEGGSIAVGSRSYGTSKSVATHSKFGTKVRDEYGRPAMTRSELDNAKAGAFLKRIAQRAGIDVAWREEDQALLDECYKSPWIGLSGGEWHLAAGNGNRAHK